MKLTIKNQFHGTEAKVNAQVLGPGRYKITKSQKQRLKKMLCGMKDCQCSDDIGQRYMMPYPEYFVYEQPGGGDFLLIATEEG